MSRSVEMSAKRIKINIDVKVDYMELEAYLAKVNELSELLKQAISLADEIACTELNLPVEFKID